VERLKIKYYMVKLIYKILIIAIPTYSIAIWTEAMVYTMPMLAITTVIATSIFNEKDVEKRIDIDFKESGKDG
tara:strand:- start:16593 stop:16811 length:219 start_codon:yes stop_codon:yes gene_type:complete